MGRTIIAIALGDRQWQWWSRHPVAVHRVHQDLAGCLQGAPHQALPAVSGRGRTLLLLAQDRPCLQRCRQCHRLHATLQKSQVLLSDCQLRFLPPSSPTTHPPLTPFPRYCPAPSGDSLTRKSLFDALVAGCVPVIFSRASLTQYKWFLSRQDVDEVAVYIPMKTINNDGGNFIAILKAIPPEELARKQAAVRRIAPSLQYSIVPDRVREDLGQTWSPPFRDAGEVVIERVLDRRTIEPVEGYTYEELKRLNLEQKLLSETHEDYAAMRTSEKTTVDSSKKKLTQAEQEREFVDRAVTKVIV